MHHYISNKKIGVVLQLLLHKAGKGELVE